MPQKRKVRWMLAKLICWGFWVAAYSFYQPRDFDGFMKMSLRTMYPYRKFTPYLFHNKAGNQWEIYLEDDADYSETGVLKCTLHRSQEDDRIVGITVLDEMLKAEKGRPTDGN